MGIQPDCHGVAPDAPMSHIAVTRPGPDGRSASWQEHVDAVGYEA
jgi:hypothetical protein